MFFFLTDMTMLASAELFMNFCNGGRRQGKGYRSSCENRLERVDLRS